MLVVMLCSAISILCAVYGVYKFSYDYTCRLTRFNKSFNNTCQKFTWIPSALVVAVVLGMAVMRSTASSMF